MGTLERGPSILEIDSPPRTMCSLREIDENSDVVLSSCEHQTFEEAIENKIWQKAINEEIVSIKKNNAWKLVDWF